MSEIERAVANLKHSGARVDVTVEGDDVSQLVARCNACGTGWQIPARRSHWRICPEGCNRNTRENSNRNVPVEPAADCRTGDHGQQQLVG